MDQQARNNRIVSLALLARSYLAQGKHAGYTETLNKLWAEIDRHRETRELEELDE